MKSLLFLFDRNNSSRVDLNVNGGTETHFLSQNIFFIVFCNSDDKVLSLPANILKYSLNINLSIKSSPSENTDLDVTPISYYDFRRAVNYCLQTDFMSENRWTKIDELADAWRKIASSTANAPAAKVQSVLNIQG